MHVLCITNLARKVNFDASTEALSFLNSTFTRSISLFFREVFPMSCWSRSGSSTLPKCIQETSRTPPTNCLFDSWKICSIIFLLEQRIFFWFDVHNRVHNCTHQKRLPTNTEVRTLHTERFANWSIRNRLKISSCSPKISRWQNQQKFWYQ